MASEANFVELRKGEVRRIPLPRTRVNKEGSGVGHQSARQAPGYEGGVPDGIDQASTTSRDPSASAGCLRRPETTMRWWRRHPAQRSTIGALHQTGSASDSVPFGALICRTPTVPKLASSRRPE